MLLRNTTQDWKTHIDHTLLNFSCPGCLPVLGKAFFDAPDQLSGFLLWLLEQSVTPCEIVNTGILQQYFEYAIFDEEQLKLTYALLKPFPDAAGFLKYLETVPPYPTTKTNTFLFINQKPRDQNQISLFESRNLMGEFFYHAEKFPERNVEFSDTLLLNPEITRYAIPLFTLFGFEFVQALNFNHPLSKIILAVLWREKQAEILKKMSTLDTKQDIELLQYIAESGSDPAALQQLIHQHPFCIYLSAFQPKLFEILSVSEVEHAVNIVFTHPNIRSRYHAVLLYKLCEQTEPIETLCNITNRIKTHLFEWVLKNDTLMSDELVERIEQLDGLSARCHEKIQHYYLEILSLIDAFCEDKIIFDVVLTRWGQYIRDVNICVDINPEIKQTENYPFTKYALYALVLQKKWGKKLTDGAAFDLQETIRNLICAESSEDDFEKVQRILLESLVHTKEPTLLEHILEKLLKTDAHHLFLTNHFDDKNIIEHAIDTHHHLLLSCLLSHKKDITHTQLTNYLGKAWIEKNWQAIQILLKTQTISQKTINQLLMCSYVNATESESNDDAVFDDKAVRFFCDLNNGYPAPNFKIFTAVLSKAIKKQQYTLIQYLCEQKSLFSQKTFEVAAQYAVSAQHWDLLAALYHTHNAKKEVAHTTQKLFLKIVACYPEQVIPFLSYTPKKHLTQQHITKGIEIAKEHKHIFLSPHLEQLLYRPHKRTIHFFSESAMERYEENEILLGGTSATSTPLATPPPENLSTRLYS